MTIVMMVKMIELLLLLSLLFLIINTDIMILRDEMKTSMKLMKYQMDQFRLTDMGPLCNYPHTLKQLDLSHNKIDNWPNSSVFIWEVLLDEPLSPSPVNSTASSSSIICYAAPERNPPKTPTIASGSANIHNKYEFVFFF